MRRCRRARARHATIGTGGDYGDAFPETSTELVTLAAKGVQRRGDGPQFASEGTQPVARAMGAAS